MQTIPSLNSFKEKYTALNSDNNLSDFVEYQKFLYLISLYPKSYLVPTKAIDKIWHLHINDYELYSKDCLDYFGFIANHKIAKTQIEINKQETNFKQTKQLWRQIFNTQLDNSSSMAFCGFDGDGGDDGGNDGSINDD